MVLDTTGRRRERMPEIPTTAYFTLALNWVYKVLLPSTRTLELGGKRSLYTGHSVCYIWLVDLDSICEQYDIPGS